MKIGILTFPNSTSYGAVLQMYALYHTVEKMGYDVEVINYHNAFMKAEKHMHAHRNKSSFGAFISKKLRVLMHHRLYSSFKRFESQHIKSYPQQPFSEKQELKMTGKRYNAVICGSDQVWNPNITDTDLSYFLDFCDKETKRISYAPSFGIEEFSQNFCNAIRTELEQFSAISVREEPGKLLINKLIDREVSVVFDPTFLVDRSEWQTMEKKYSVVEGDYILYYTVRHSDNLYRKCKEFSEKTGMKIVIVGGNYLKKLQNKNSLMEYAIDVKPEEWLYLMHNARYVVTNSFHGTAFSIIYRKDFFVEYPSFASSRLVQLISKLGLETRVMHDNVEFGSEPVSYELAEIRLSKEKESAMLFLKEALQL